MSALAAMTSFQPIPPLYTPRAVALRESIPTQCDCRRCPVAFWPRNRIRNPECLLSADGKASPPRPDRRSSNASCPWLKKSEHACRQVEKAPGTPTYLQKRRDERHLALKIP